MLRVVPLRIPHLDIRTSIHAATEALRAAPRFRVAAPYAYQHFSLKNLCISATMHDAYERSLALVTPRSEISSADVRPDFAARRHGGTAARRHGETSQTALKGSELDSTDSCGTDELDSLPR